MKRLVLVVLVLFLAVTAAYAQSDRMQVTVPFAFHVQDSHAVAGDYLVKYLRAGSTTLIFENKTTSESVAVRTFNADVLQNFQNSPKLVFHKYGDEYFLVSATMPNQLVQGLPESNSEREAVTHRVITKLNPENITVFARAAK